MQNLQTDYINLIKQILFKNVKSITTFFPDNLKCLFAQKTTKTVEGVVVKTVGRNE